MSKKLVGAAKAAHEAKLAREAAAAAAAQQLPPQPQPLQPQPQQPSDGGTHCSTAKTQWTKAFSKEKALSVGKATLRGAQLATGWVTSLVGLSVGTVGMSVAALGAGINTVGLLLRELGHNKPQESGDGNIP